MSFQYKNPCGIEVEVKLSRIFCRWLCQYLPEKEAQVLQELLSNQDKPVEIETKDYNWLLNKL